MPEIFYLQADYGLSITYEWNNKITESFIGVDYCNAQWAHPIAKINFSQAWFDQNRYDYIVYFYFIVKGNQDIFLVEDPIDHEVTHLPLNNKEIITRGVVREIDGELQLCKRYRLGNNFIDRPITRPNTVFLYDSNGVLKTGYVVNPDTGKITTGGNLTDTWEGNFYIPMRFENDVLPVEIQGYDKDSDIITYSLPDLRLTEEKENLTKIPLSLAKNYDHYLQIETQIGTQFETKTKTDIYVAESGYSDRDSLNSSRINVSFPSFNADQVEINYLIGLQRLLLGDSGNFKYLDINADIDSRFRLLNPISFTTLVNTDEVNLCSVNQLNFIEDNIFTKSTFCHIWRIRRKDLIENWFTNHDQIIQIDSVNKASPVVSPVATASSKTIDVKVDSTELTSVFGIQITEADLLDQKYNYAELEVSLYDWTLGEFVSRLFTGNLGSYTVGYLANKAKQFQFEAVSLVEKLESSKNVQTSSQCRHKFLSIGYGNCNLTPLGRDDPLYQFSVCNKTIGACQSYGNIANYGGQPRLPGIDEIVSNPEL